MKLSDPCNKTHMRCGHCTISLKIQWWLISWTLYHMLCYNFQPSQHVSTNTILGTVWATILQCCVLLI